MAIRIRKLKVENRGVAHVEEGRELERVPVDLSPVVPENSLPRLGIFSNVAVEPARRSGSRKSMQRRRRGSPEEPEDSEDDQGDEESGQPGK